jgi:hypothetical protein
MLYEHGGAISTSAAKEAALTLASGGSMPRVLFNPAFFVVALGMLYPLVARADSPPARYTDLTADFARFVDDTTGMDDAARVAAFKSRMNALLPGFYVPRFGVTPERYDARITAALADFSRLRPRYELLQRDFPAAFETGIRHFRRDFPGFMPDVPVYLLHSLGEMDGGTRELGGRTYLIFGADVIAQIHEPRDLTPFLDHELFHVEHHRNFPDCDEVWCPLWAEGLATFAAKTMNPGADDRQLLLTFPRPIRAAVDSTWPRALCITRAKLSSTAPADMDALFVGGAAAQEFPDRFGYYVGLRIAEEAGSRFKLPALAQMPPAQARATLTAAIERLIEKGGGCP